MWLAPARIGLARALCTPTRTTWGFSNLRKITLDTDASSIILSMVRVIYKHLESATRSRGRTTKRFLNLRKITLDFDAQTVEFELSKIKE